MSFRKYFCFLFLSLLSVPALQALRSAGEDEIPYAWGIPEEGTGTPECRAALLEIVKEGSTAKAFELYLSSGPACQHTAFIDEDVCAEGCDYALALISLIDRMIREKNYTGAKKAVRLGFTFDKNLTYEIAGDGYVLTEELLKRNKALKKKPAKKKQKKIKQLPLPAPASK